MPRTNSRLGSGGQSSYGGGFQSRRPTGGSSTAFQPTGDVEKDLLAYRLRSALAAVQSGPKNDVATQKIATLLASPNKDAQAVGAALRSTEGLDAATAESLGIEPTLEKENKDRSVSDRLIKAAGPALEALKFIGRPAQAAQEVIQAGAYDLGLEDFFNGDTEVTHLNNPGNLSPEAAQVVGDAAGSGGYRDALRALAGKKRWDPTSQTYTEDLTLAGALGQDPNQLGSDALGRTVNTANFIGTAALDPLNFVGAGEAKTAGLAAEKAAGLIADDAARELTPALAKQLAKQGTEEVTKETVAAALKRTGLRKGLSEGQQSSLRSLLEQEAADAGGRTTRNLITGTTKTAELKGPRGYRRATLALTGQGGRSPAEHVAAETLDKAMRFDRGGLRVAGRSVIPEAVRSPVRGALRGETRVLGSAGAEAAVFADAADKADDLLAASARNAEKAAGREAEAALIRAADPEGALAVDKQVKRYRTLAQNQADRADELVAETDAARLMEMEPTFGNVQSRVMENVPRKILPGLAKPQSKVAEWFRPRAGMRASESLMPGTDELANLARVQGNATTTQIAHEGERILNGALADGVSPELIDETRRAMDIGGDIGPLLAKATPEEAAYINGMDRLRKRIYDLNIEKKLADPKKLRARDDYMPRYVTPEAEAALEEARRLYPTDKTIKKFSTAKAAAGQNGHLLKRTVFPDATLDEINDMLTPKLQELGLLPEGKTAIELDPAKILSRRFNETLPALQLKEQVTAMEKSIKGSFGEDLVKVYHPGEKAADLTKRGMEPIPLDEYGDLGIIYAHPDIAPEIRQFVKSTVDPDAVGDFGKIMDGWNRMWKSYATVPIITGTGFHAKNTVGNMFNNYLAGVRSYAYPEAAAIQKEIWQAKRAFPDLSVPEAMLANGADADRVAKVELALENQVLEEGFFNTDLKGKADLAINGRKTRGQKALAKIDVRNPDKMFGVPTGRKIGEHIEDNARLAHFISKMDETGDAVRSAQSVRKYLFDYGDLTPAEQKVMKRIHAFYTFTRKNTPLQFAEIARNPAALNRLAEAKQFVLGDEKPDMVPGFMGEIGSPTGNAQSGFLAGNGNQVVGNIDTPFDAAGKTVDPLLILAGKRGNRSAQDAAQGVVGNISGGPAELGKAFFEYGTGSSAFSGGELKDPETGKYKINPAVRISNAFAPNISKGLRIMGSDLAGKPSDSARLRVIKALTGVQAKEVTQEMRDMAKNEDIRSIEDIIKALKARGVDVPTLQELQAVGVLDRPKSA